MTIEEKFVKAFFYFMAKQCRLQISLQFDEIFDSNVQILILRSFEIFNKRFSSKTCWDTLYFRVNIIFGAKIQISVFLNTDLDEGIWPPHFVLQSSSNKESCKFPTKCEFLGC